MSSLQETNFFCNEEELLKQKVLNNPFSAPLACVWGTVFEVLIRQYIKNMTWVWQSWGGWLAKKIMKSTSDKT